MPRQEGPFTNYLSPIFPPQAGYQAFFKLVLYITRSAFSFVLIHGVFCSGVYTRFSTVSPWEAGSGLIAYCGLVFQFFLLP